MTRSRMRVSVDYLIDDCACRYRNSTMKLSEYIFHSEARVECWRVKNMLYHFYGNTTDLYTKGLERTLVLLW
jgi:hypothetical protein